MSTIMFGLNNGIYSIHELHTLGISEVQPKQVKLNKEGMLLDGWLSFDCKNPIVNCENYTSGYVSLPDLLSLGITINPTEDGYCIIYIKPDEICLGEISDKSITYKDITESLAEFYSCKDRIVVREICNVYKDDKVIKAFKDNNVLDDKQTILSEMVELPDGLLFGKYEVTRSLYKSVIGTDPSNNYPCTEADCDNRPVDNINLQKAIEFCNALSICEGIVPFYADIMGSESSEPGHEHGYRIPTKLEWESAALAGETTRYAGTDGLLPDGNNDSKQLVFISDPIGYEESESGVSIPVYDESSSFAAAPTNEYTNPNNTSIANVGDPELAKYAWTKFNIRTGECENVPQPAEFISGYGQWKVYKYRGNYYKSNAYGQAGCRSDVNDNIYGTRAVGQKLPNGYGLYDMTGNASEITLTNGNVLFVGGDSASNTSKIYVGHPTYECKIAGLRVCRNK